MDNAAAVPKTLVPLDQEYVVPPFADTEMLVCVQVRTVVFELFQIPATGAVIF